MHRRHHRRRSRGGCERVSQEKSIPVMPVQADGFKSNKREGYPAVCRAMVRLMGTGDTTASPNQHEHSGRLQPPGEIWMIRDDSNRIGIEVVANITGDGRVEDIRRAHGAALNVVQCSGATMDLAKMMEKNTASRPHACPTSGSRTWLNPCTTSHASLGSSNDEEGAGFSP